MQSLHTRRSHKGSTIIKYMQKAKQRIELRTKSPTRDSRKLLVTSYLHPTTTNNPTRPQFSSGEPLAVYDPHQKTNKLLTRPRLVKEKHLGWGSRTGPPVMFMTISLRVMCKVSSTQQTYSGKCLQKCSPAKLYLIMVTKLKGTKSRSCHIRHPGACRTGR